MLQSFRVRTFVCAASVFAFIAGSSPASAQSPASFTVAEFDPPAAARFPLYGFGSGTSRVAQSFTPTRDGKVDKIRVLLQQNGDVPPAVMLELRALDPLSGMPSPEILASAAANTSSLSATPAYFTADFSSANVVLLQGRQYAFSLRIAQAATGASAVGALQGDADPYAGGSMIRSSDGVTWTIPSSGNYDLGFRVTAVPAVVTSPDGTFGAGKLSVDLITGLEWLDLTMTVNKSPAQILAGEGNYLAAGFRLATPAEVQALWEHFGMTRFNAPTADAQDFAAATAIADTMGATLIGSGAQAGATELVGYTADPSSANSFKRSLVSAFTSSTFCSQYGLSTPCARAYVGDSPIGAADSNGYTGAFLVRDRDSLDQSFSPFDFIGGDISVNGYQIGGNLQQSLAQTFTVGRNGQLSRVAVQVGGFGPLSQPVRVELRSTNNGVPSETVLASATIPVSTIQTANPTNAFSVVELDTPLQVAAGSMLALVLTSQETAGSYSWKGATSFSSPPPPLYAGGDGLFRNTNNPNWRASGTTDYGFRTYVDASSGGDVTAPQLTLPGAMTLSATGPAGRVVAFSASAVDNIDPAPQVSCTPSSGTLFPLGTTTVTCVATDASGNSTQGTFTIRIVDTDAPAWTSIPSPQPVEATSPAGAVVTWTAPSAVDQVDGSVPVTCSTPSGSTFAIGATTVTCSAVDAAGNATNATFGVTVRDTTAPTVTILSPLQDAVITATPASVTLTVSDQVGVAAVTVNGVNATLTAGSAQNGTWTAAVSVTTFGTVLTFNAVARDAALNAANASVIVDNDGIAAAIDKTAAGVDQTAAYNTSFTDGVTQGFFSTRNPANTRVTAVRLVTGSIRLAVAGDVSAYALIYLCGGNKYVRLHGGESVDVKCNGSTATVSAVTASPVVDLFKEVWSHYYYSYTYYVTTYYDCGSLFYSATCWYTTPYTRSYPVYYTYWSQTMMQAGQTVSTGSPTTAAAGNASPVGVRLLRRYRDEEVDAVVASFALDPGESVDSSIVSGATETEPEKIQLEVLNGAITVTVLGQTHNLGQGPATILEVLPPRTPQSITFAAQSNRHFGDQAFDLEATSTSGLPVSFSAAGACTVSGNRVTLTGVRDCTITASQPGNESYDPASPVSRTFSVWYSWTGVLQPVNANNTSVFKLGSTVPVKFALTDASAGVVNLGARFYATKVGTGIVGTELEAAATFVSDSGNVFRYDASAGQYIFNWGTKGLSEGTWQIRVDLLDGNGERKVLVSLRK